MTIEEANKFIEADKNGTLPLPNWYYNILEHEKNAFLRMQTTILALVNKNRRQALKDVKQASQTDEDAKISSFGLIRQRIITYLKQQGLVVNFKGKGKEGDEYYIDTKYGAGGFYAADYAFLDRKFRKYIYSLEEFDAAREFATAYAEDTGYSRLEVGIVWESKPKLRAIIVTASSEGTIHCVDLVNNLFMDYYLYQRLFCFEPIERVFGAEYLQNNKDILNYLVPQTDEELYYSCRYFALAYEEMLAKAKDHAKEENVRGINDN